MPVRQPQVRVTIDGDVVPGVVALEVEQVAHFSAARFSVTFALGSAKDFGHDFFAAVGSKPVTIEAADAAYGLRLILSGRAENIVDDFKAGTVAIFGRDFAASLIDTEISETFANQTSSQVATTISGRHGLTANLTTTSTPIGQYYDLDHARSGLGLNSRGGTEWNLLSWLAMIEGFSLSVVGSVLNFGQFPVIQPYVLTPQGCIELRIDTVSTLPTMATVRSWNTRNKAAIVQSFGNGSTPISTLIRPNLTSQEASKIAQNHLSVLNNHRTVLSLSMPGEFTLVPGGIVELLGSGSQYDQAYGVDAVIRSVTAVAGFVQHVRAHALV